jgi:putative transposase
VKFTFVAAERASFPVIALCRVLEVSRSGFYAWCRRSPSNHSKLDAILAEEVRALHVGSRHTYGSPRVHRSLRARGVRVGRKRVARLMKASGIFAKRRRKFKTTTDSKHANPIAPDLLRRNFQVDAPNKVWVTDVTAIPTVYGWLYLAAILDLCSRRIVGWATSECNDRHLALEALRRAVFHRRPPRGLIHHSDRGSPYASDDYLAALRAHGMRPSMSRKGDCWDNAVAESFFATLKGDLCDRRRYLSHQAAHASIADYIDNFYNPQRRHSTLDYVSPIEFELKLQSLNAAA